MFNIKNNIKVELYRFVLRKEIKKNAFSFMWKFCERDHNREDNRS